MSETSPNMVLHRVPVERMNPAPYNPRVDLQPSDPEYQAIRNSIESFGYLDPVVWNQRTGNIVSGHQRFKILVADGATEMDAIVVDFDEDKEKACNLALNKAVGLWDTKALDSLLEEMKLTDWDMSDFGFDLMEEPEVEEDDFDESSVPDDVPPTTQRGDVFSLGRHTLMCGDSTDPKAVETLRGGRIADLVVTDPPYNVDYEGSTGMTIDNDNMALEEFHEFLIKAFNNLYDSLKAGGSFYVWHASRSQRVFEDALNEVGLEVRQQLIWNKNSLVLSRQDYQWKHEPCFYGWKDGAGHWFVDDRTQTTVLDFDRPTKNDLHPTMKPVALIARQIQNSSKRGETVLDLFGGSGTTLIASEQTDRTCLMMEYDPHYCDVIIARWEQMTGMKAERRSI